MYNPLNDEEREKLRLENEIRKIKMELEKGARFSSDPDMPSLPPEIENEFLNYIEEFESLNEQTARTTIFELIGKPDFKKPEELSDEAIDVELDRLFDLLHAEHLEVTSVHDVDNREMYRFLIEDFFPYEVFEMKKIKGMVTHFIYEEFYPDDVRDVIALSEDFFQAFLNLGDEEQVFQSLVDDNGNTLQWMFAFRSAYERFDVQEINVREVQVHDYEKPEATAVYEIAFDAYTAGKPEKHVYQGKANLSLVYTPGGWMISELQLPKPV